MAVVAGLFDSEVDATEAMDKLLRAGIEDLDTHVIDGSGSYGAEGPNVILPLMPNTGGTPTGMPQGGLPVAGGAAFGWLDELDEVESAFYHEGLREGATLALAKVRDEDAAQVRQLFRSFNARTHTTD